MSRFPMHTFQQDAILARLSQALVALEVTNVKSLTSEQCDKLQCGDVVVKKDSSGEHSYVVTFKSDTGMCLTYMDASVVETQSYDKVGNNWVYNSEDKASLPINGELDGDININGDLTANSIIENMEGYSLTSYPISDEHKTVNNIYASVCKNGNKLTFVVFGSVTLKDSSADVHNMYYFIIPADVLAKLYPYEIGGGYYLDNRTIQGTQKSDWGRKTLSLDVVKGTDGVVIDVLSDLNHLVVDEETYFRVEQTFLLSDNLIPQP